MTTEKRGHGKEGVTNPSLDLSALKLALKLLSADQLSYNHGSITCLMGTWKGQVAFHTEVV